MFLKKDELDTIDLLKRLGFYNPDKNLDIVQIFVPDDAEKELDSEKYKPLEHTINADFRLQSTDDFGKVYQKKDLSKLLSSSDDPDDSEFGTQPFPLHMKTAQSTLKENKRSRASMFEDVLNTSFIVVNESTEDLPAGTQLLLINRLDPADFVPLMLASANMMDCIAGAIRDKEYYNKFIVFLNGVHVSLLAAAADAITLITQGADKMEYANGYQDLNDVLKKYNLYMYDLIYDVGGSNNFAANVAFTEYYLQALRSLAIFGVVTDISSPARSVLSNLATILDKKMEDDLYTALYSIEDQEEEKEYTYKDAMNATTPESPDTSNISDDTVDTIIEWNAKRNNQSFRG